jgi:hypothetical protein
MASGILVFALLHAEEPCIKKKASCTGLAKTITEHPTRLLEKHAAKPAMHRNTTFHSASQEYQCIPELPRLFKRITFQTYYEAASGTWKQSSHCRIQSQLNGVPLNACSHSTHLRPACSKPMMKLTRHLSRLSVSRSRALGLPMCHVRE